MFRHYPTMEALGRAVTARALEPWLREVDGLFREVRMVPLSKVFGVYPRAVRDLAEYERLAHEAKATEEQLHVLAARV